MLPNKFLQRKGPCIYRAIACKSSVLYVRLPCLLRLSEFLFYNFRKFRKSAFYTMCVGGCRVIKLPLNGGKAMESPLQGHTDFGTKSSVLHLARRGV